MLARDKPRLVLGRPFELFGWILIGFGVLAMLTWVGLSRHGV